MECVFEGEVVPFLCDFEDGLINERRTPREDEALFVDGVLFSSVITLQKNIK